MSLLNHELASSLQYVTVPLEFVGILLAVVELHFPKVSRLASEHIVREGLSYFAANNSKRAIETIVATFLGVVLVLLLSYLDSPIVETLLSYAVLSIAVSYAIAAYWIPERAIATFGLCLASFGLCGEVYQLCVMLFGSPAT